MNRSLFESIIIEQFQTKIKTATFIPSHHLGRLTPKAFSTICSTNFHHHWVSNISFLSHNPVIHAFANIDLTINQLSPFSLTLFSVSQQSFFAAFLPTHPKIPFSTFFLLSTFICGHIVPRPASRLETCLPGHAWDLTIHDSCLS